jgi:hypothetical protein
VAAAQCEQVRDGVDLRVGGTTAPIVCWPASWSSRPAQPDCAPRG